MKILTFKECFILILSLASLAIFLSNTAGCGDDQPVAPSPVLGHFSTGFSTYVCDDGSPLWLTKEDGKGLFNVQITTMNAPQFQRNKTHDIFSPSIDCGNIENCCIAADFPETDDYNVNLMYAELPTLSCITDNPTYCYRWLFMDIFDSGFLPTCSNIVFVNTPDNPITGPCPDN